MAQVLNGSEPLNPGPQGSSAEGKGARGPSSHELPVPAAIGREQRNLRAQWQRFGLARRLLPVGTPRLRPTAEPPAAGLSPTHSGSSREREMMMKRADLTEKILDIKREKGWTWR
ncbi:MAG TPA: hypothetical protein VGO82_06900, partial [Enterovirga sp.]|nr:hypothetical protein [Enterovirga sp.]